MFVQIALYGGCAVFIFQLADRHVNGSDASGASFGLMRKRRALHSQRWLIVLVLLPHTSGQMVSISCSRVALETSRMLTSPHLCSV